MTPFSGELLLRQHYIEDLEVKKLIIIAAIAFGAWQIYKHQNPDLSFSETAQAEQTRKTAQTTSNPTSQLHCDGRQYCSQMTSRAEAEFFTRNCPNTKMDGDHDGIPCENDSRF